MPSLDRPVWAALSVRQSRFARGGGFAKRFDPDITPFAAARDETADSIKALGELVRDADDYVVLLQVDAVSVPDTLYADFEAPGVQMVKSRAVERPDHAHDIVPLGPADAPEMLALARLTEPGPFMLRTRELGSFWGVKLEGRLAAMAGERMMLDGHTEVSGVCTHPDFRGRGLAAALSRHVTAQIEARGETPFLHAYADNVGAIRLYESLGFQVRLYVNVAVLKRRLA